MKDIKRLWITSKQINKLFILCLLYCIIGLSGILFAYSMGSVTQNALNLNTSQFLNALLLLIAAKLIQTLCECISKLYSRKLTQNTIANFRTYTAKSILNSTYSHTTQLKKGDLLGRMNTEVKNAAAILPFSVELLNNVIVLIILLVALAIDDYRLALAFLIPIPIFFLGQKLSSIISKKYFVKFLETGGHINAQAQNFIQYRSTIKTYCVENKVICWLEELLKKYIYLATRGITGLFLASKLGMIASYISIMLTAIVGVNLAVAGEITLEQFVAAFIIVQMLSESLLSLIRFFLNFPHMISSAERMFKLWDSPKDETGAITNGTDDNIIFSFQNVNFAYQTQDAENNVLNDFCLDVNKGECVALVGTSGCGKSTVISLMSALYTTESVYCWGIPLLEWNKDALRNKIAVVSQDTSIFDGTIEENIRMGNLNASFNEVVEAAKVAQIYSFIESLPQGWQTKTGEHGAELSGGQRQRIGIARAILKKAPLLLLDEATSMLDEDTEKNLLNDLKHFLKDCTMITITHRLTTVHEMDRIIVLDKGSVVEQGTHDELIKIDHLYANLHNQQSKI